MDELSEGSYCVSKEEEFLMVISIGRSISILEFSFRNFEEDFSYPKFFPEGKIALVIFELGPVLGPASKGDA